jgi:hypothetical protein
MKSPGSCHELYGYWKPVEAVVSKSYYKGGLEGSP